MTAPAATRAAINSRDQYEVLSRYGRGGEIAAIVTGTGLSNDFVSGVVSTLAGFDRGRARTLATDFERKPAPAKPAAEPDASPPDPIADLLSRAESTGDARLIRLVKRVREGLAEIGERHAAMAAELEAAAKVTAARAALDAALAELRQIRGGPPPATGAPSAPEQDRDRNARIRAWAAKNGHRVAARGTPAKAVVRAYTEATGDA